LKSCNYGLAFFQVVAIKTNLSTNMKANIEFLIQ